MTGRTCAGRRGTTDEATGPAAGRRGVFRLFRRAEDPDRSSRRAGVDQLPRVAVAPRMWIALG
jgi:hypothetical protein